MVFSMVFITSFHSSFNTRFSTVFSQILANNVRLAGGGDRRKEGEMSNQQYKEANTVFLKKEMDEKEQEIEQKKGLRRKAQNYLFT